MTPIYFIKRISITSKKIITNNNYFTEGEKNYLFLEIQRWLKYTHPMYTINQVINLYTKYNNNFNDDSINFYLHYTIIYWIMYEDTHISYLTNSII